MEQKYLTTKELSAMFNLKEIWVRKAVFKREIPHFKINRLVRFDSSEILKWLEEKKVAQKNAT